MTHFPGVLFIESKIVVVERRFSFVVAIQHVIHLAGG